jgi:hypothetical protein
VDKLKALPKDLWAFLDGWKTWIWAVAMALKTVFPAWPIWSVVDSIANVIGWSDVIPAVDPDQLVQWVWFAVAVGHRLAKAIAQYRAGVPIQGLLSGK